MFRMDNVPQSRWAKIKSTILTLCFALVAMIIVDQMGGTAHIYGIDKPRIPLSDDPRCVSMEAFDANPPRGDENLSLICWGPDGRGATPEP